MREYFVRIEIEGNGGKFVDITDVCAGEFVYEDNAFKTDMLVFTIIRGAISYMDTLTRGTKVKFFGGYSEAQDYSLLFNGVIANMQPIFPNGGIPRLKVIVYDYSYLLTLNKPGNVSYPSENCKRGWGRVDEIKLSEIVKGIIGEYSELRWDDRSVAIPQGYDKKYSLKSPMIQKEDESDWDFVHRLLQGSKSTARKSLVGNTGTDLGAQCIAFVEMRGSDPWFYVVPEQQAKEEKGLVTFAYQMEGVPLIQNFDPTASDAALFIKDVDVRENANHSKTKPKKVVTLNSNGTRTVTTYDDAGAIEETVVYELDVEVLAQDEAKGLIKASDVQIGTADAFERVKKYWKPIETKYPPSSTVKAPVEGGAGGGEQTVEPITVDQLGWELSCSSRGSIYLYAKRSYEVKNLGGKYSGFWFLESVEHEFRDVYTCNLNFTR